MNLCATISRKLRVREVCSRTVQAIRDSLEASLKTIFVMGAVAMAISFLLVVTIPEVSMEVKSEDR
jgi:hypothetical protein